MTNGCSQKLSQLIAVYVVHHLLLAWISSVYIDKELAWLRFERSTSSSRVSVKPFRKLLGTEWTSLVNSEMNSPKGASFYKLAKNPFLPTGSFFFALLPNTARKSTRPLQSSHYEPLPLVHYRKYLLPTTGATMDS